MPASVIVSFVVVFALVLLAVSVGMKFLESRRKSQVAGMLKTASGEQDITASNLLREPEPEKPSGVHAALASLDFLQKAQTRIREAGLDWTANRLAAAMIGMAVPGLIVGALFPVLMNGPTTALVLAVIGAAMPYLYVGHKRKKRLDTLEEQFPEALDFLARSMRAGHAFTISMEMLGEEIEDPLGQEFRALFNEQNLGAPLDVALRNFADRVPLLDARFFTSSVLLQKQTGGNLSEILARLAYVIRERFRLRGQVKAASSHGRLTATILAILPIATLAGLMCVAPSYIQSMAQDPDGKWLIAGSVIAQIVGNLVIKKIINIKV